jgi:hypothetical protein
MAITDRAAEAYGGPRGGTTWYDEGLGGQVGFTKTAATVNGTLEEIAFVVPTPNLIVQPGDLYLDALDASNVIQACYGVWIVPLAAWSASPTNVTNIQAVLRRAGAVVGGGAFAGWQSNGAIPALPQWRATFLPWLPANTALMPGRVGGSVGTGQSGAFLPLQPLDVLTIQIITGASQQLTSLLQVAYSII